ncbi:MAG: hypothetical protein C0601_13275 [Candidatus Muiribacterium halophilum]|uniref:HD domain-containing protein n=1 Tax=Muiribacterium halophilum TaxID=2053465 RepID=A0A2N5Z9L0_MUIH1|nr:MAG: hypothetical protein C0601_13275 [Candidatus Muirbacterium halophilum]
MLVSDLIILNDLEELCLTEKRMAHMSSAANLFDELSKIYDFKKEQEFRNAVLYHDIARDLSRDRLEKEILEGSVSITSEERKKTVLLHAPVGAWLVQKYGLVSDVNMIDAIRHHTLLKRDTEYVKILSICDFAEKKREFIEAEMIREIAKKDIDEAYRLMKKIREDWQGIKNAGRV